MTRNATHVPDAVFTAFREHFEEAEIVEIACVVGLFAYFNRFNEALQVEPTQPGEGIDT